MGSSKELCTVGGLGYLLVTESGSVVDEREGVVGVAVSAEGRLGDAAALHLDVGLQVAHGAAEEAATDLGNQVGGADDHARDGDQLVDV